jgi:hypothetical protein
MALEIITGCAMAPRRPPFARQYFTNSLNCAVPHLLSASAPYNQKSGLSACGRLIDLPR